MADQVFDNLTVNKQSKMLGNVGIGTDNPICELDVSAKMIKLGLEKNGGGQLRIFNNPNDNYIYLEAFNSKGDGSAKDLVLCGKFGNNVPTLELKANNTIFGGSLEVGKTKVNQNGIAMWGGPKNVYTIWLDNEKSTIAMQNPQTNTYTVLIDGTKGDITLWGADCAEDFEISTKEQVDPGTVMALNDDGKLVQSEKEYDKRVAGIISGAGDLKPGLVLGRQAGITDRVPLALMGRVNCKVDAEYDRIEVGDLLTTSETPGHAMKASDPTRSFGAVIGKALKPLKVGQDLIPILVALQ